MIAKLTGKISEIFNSTVTIDVNGVGYEVFCSQECIQSLQIDHNAVITIYTDVKEDSISLYGFKDSQEKQVFLLLRKVKGVGARTGSQIISRVNKLELLRIIGSSDLTKLQSIKGIGKKLAERIIVELRDQVAEFVNEQVSSSVLFDPAINEPYNDALSALQALGFSRKDAENAINQVKASGVIGVGKSSKDNDSGNIVREALKYV